MLPLSTYLLHPASSKHHQRGISLIESLVAMVVMALGILGILGVQMRTLSDTSTSVRRAQAVRLIEDLGERMKASPNALGNLGDYVSTFSNMPMVGSCAAGCNAAALAKRDLAVWKRTIQNTLPLGQASVFVPPAEAAPGFPIGQRRQLGVMIAWRENEGKGHKTADIDATKVRDAGGALTDGTDTANACPADFTCHLQYIPVAGRCAPYAPGGGTPTYYCPGP